MFISESRAACARCLTAIGAHKALEEVLEDDLKHTCKPTGHRWNLSIYCTYIINLILKYHLGFVGVALSCWLPLALDQACNNVRLLVWVHHRTNHVSSSTVLFQQFLSKQKNIRKKGFFYVLLQSHQPLALHQPLP